MSYARFRAGTVESRIRQLVMKLELVESMEIVHPFVKGFEKTYHCMSADEVRAVARGEVSEQISRQTENDIEGKEGGGTVYVTSFFIGLEIQPKKGKCFSLAFHIADSSCSRYGWTTKIRFIFSYVGIY